jgi:energy-coupling factor transporter ATP-binding protein EcfA2
VVILELALYGIRSFTQLTRLVLKPGLNLIQGGNGSGKSTVRDILFAVLSPMSETPVDSFKPLQPLDICQAGMIFKFRDGRICRLVRDFNGRKSSLAELDSSNKFQVKMQDEGMISKFLTEEAGGLSRNALEGLSSMRGAWMPSSRSTAVRPETATTPFVSRSPAVAANESNMPPQDRASKQKRLEELKALLSQGDRLAAMEDQLSDLQARSAQSKRRLRLATEKTAELDRLALQEESFESLRELPENHHLILETSAQQEQLKNEQIASISEEEEFIKQDLLAISNQPFFLNKYFIAGGALVLTPLVVLASLNLGGVYQQVLMFALLGGVGLMGYAGFLDFGKLNKRKVIEHKLRDTERQKAKVEAAFKKENTPCIELLKKTGSADIPSLKEKIRAYEQYTAVRRDLESERSDHLGQKTLEELQADTDGLVRQISELESKLKASSTLPSDIYLLQEEVRVLERNLAESRPDLPPLPTTAVAIEPLPPSPDGGASDFLSPVFRVGLRAAAVQPLLSGGLPDLNAEITRLIGRLIGKGGGLRPADMSMNEELSPVLVSHAKTPIPWEVLSSGQQDLYHLILQFAVIHFLSRSHAFPLILDNPLSVLDSAHQQMVLDILREIAQNRQVFLLSSVEYPNREGDHLIHLK